ncbi:MAG: sensor histidine kinase [Burkholderiales bacterium]|nr:sensor histidine kinase [Burkholderiales bacterium]
MTSHRPGSDAWRRLWRLALLLLAGLAWLPAMALVLPADGGLTAPVSLHGHMAVLVDPEGRLDVADAAARDGEFQPVPGALARGFTRDVLWVRFELARDPAATRLWFLEVGPTFLDEVTLFEPQAGGTFRAIELGDRRPYAGRPVPDVRFVFPLQLDERPAVYYLRVRSTSALLVQAGLWQEPGLLAARSATDLGMGLTLGAIGIMSIFNVIFWLWFREREQIYYAVYLATMGAHLVFLGGHAARWLFPWQPWLADHGVGVVIGLNCMAALLFANHTFELRRLMPRVSRLFIVMACFFAGVVAVALMGRYDLVVAPMNMVALSLSLFGIVLPAILMMQGHRHNFVYLLAFVVFSLANLPASLRLQGVAGMDVLADPLMRVGVVLHLVLLNIALVYRVRRADLAARRQRQEALAASLEAERVLESRVAQRTLSLQTEVERRTVLEQQLRAALDTEKQALAQQRRFVAMVSHEFRTPLAVIHAATQSLGLMPGADEPRIRERVDKIGRAAGRLSAMIDNYLTEDRLSMEQLRLQPRLTDLNALVGEMLSVSLRDEQGSRLRLESDGAVHVLCDPGLTAVAISNLVQNALKYAPAETPVVLRLTTHAGRAVIDVADQGGGIAPEDVQRIFAKYFRAEAAGRMPGTGLGLYLARAIALAQHGDVQLVRTGPRGSLFRLTLPLSDRKVPDFDT